MSDSLNRKKHTASGVKLTQRPSGGWTKAIGGRRFYWPAALSQEEAQRQASILRLTWQRMKRQGEEWTDERIDAALAAGGTLPSNRAMANARRTVAQRQQQREAERRQNDRLHAGLDDFLTYTGQREVSQAYKARAGSAIALVKRIAPDVRLAEFDLQRLGTLVDELNRGRAHATIRTTLHFLNSALTYLDTRGRYELTLRSLRLLKPGRQRATVAVEVFSVDEISLLYGKASLLIRACMMMALNCGFTVADLATLTHENFTASTVTGKDGDAATIPPQPAGVACSKVVTVTKARTKTGIGGSWTLWPETVEALMQIGWTVEHRGLTLKTAAGSPLVHYCAESGERADALGRAWHRLTRSLAEERQLGFKHLRKTGATWVETVSSETVAQTYLAHVSGSVARRHYLAPNGGSNEQLRQALTAVRERCVLPMISKGETARLEIGRDRPTKTHRRHG